MAKRFTDSNKYKKQFIRNLPAAYKIFWDYLYHDCNHAGIWQVDFEVAQIFIGKDAVINKDEALKLFNRDEERIMVLSNGSKWFIKKFIEVQYGCTIEKLNPLNRLHLSVINELKKEGAYKPLARTLQGPKEKNKNKDKEKEKKKENNINNKKKYLDFVMLTDEEFEKLVKTIGKYGANDYIDKLNIGIGSKGYKYKSHYFAILSWWRKDGKPAHKRDIEERKTKEFNEKYNFEINPEEQKKVAELIRNTKM